MNIYLNDKEADLLIEAIDMLEMDYPEGHPEIKMLRKLEQKILDSQTRNRNS